MDMFPGSLAVAPEPFGAPTAAGFGALVNFTGKGMGRDSQNRREDFAVGIRSLRSILAEDSIDIRDHIQQRADDYILARDIAAQRGIPIEAILNPNKVTAPPEIVAAPAA